MSRDAPRKALLALAALAPALFLATLLLGPGGERPAPGTRGARGDPDRDASPAPPPWPSPSPPPPPWASPPPTGHAPPPVVTAALSVLVLDEASGAAVASAEVAALTSTGLVEAATDAAGRAVLAAPVGPVALHVDAPSHLPGGPLVLDLPPGGREVRVLLRAGHSIAGVARLSGAPLPGVRVEVASASLRHARVATTLDDGRYEVRGLPPGTVEVTARAQGVSPPALQVERSLPAIPPSSQPGAAPERLAIDFDFRPGVACRGVVVEAGTRAPIAGATVEAQVYGLFEPCTAVTDGLGAFAFPSLPGQTVLLLARAAGYVREEGEVRDVHLAAPEVVVELRLARAGSISGRVLDPNGRGFASVLVLARERRTSAPRRGQTGRDGRFVLASLPPGDYEVTADCPGYVSPVVEGVAVTAGADAAAGDLRLAFGVAVAGRVLDADGRPAPGARVVGLIREPRFVELHAVADDQGEFELAGLPSQGQVAVQAHVGPSGMTGPEVLVQLGPADARGVVLRLLREERVQGVVRDAAGAPVPDALVLPVGTPAAGAARAAAGGAFALPTHGLRELSLLVYARGFRPARVRARPGAPVEVVLGASGPEPGGAGPVPLRGRLRLFERRVAGLLVLAVPAGAAGDGPDAPPRDLVALDPALLVETTAGDDGSFQLDLPAPGTWELAAIEVRPHHEGVTTTVVTVPPGGTTIEWEFPTD